MSGRKPIIINLRATSPEGEVSYFRTLKTQLENWDSMKAQLRELITLIGIG